MKTEWAAKHHNISFFNKDFEHPTIHLIIAISKENGIEGTLLYEKSPDSKDFCKIYEEIAKNGVDFEIFVDQASWHTSLYTRKFFKEKGNEVLLNVPYEPELNCAEYALSMIKNYFKRIKL
jgi:transposase